MFSKVSDVRLRANVFYGSLFHMQTDQCEKRRARALAELGAKSCKRCTVARSRSMRMIVGEDAVC